MASAEYRPRFVLWTSFLAQLPLQIFFSFWVGGFFGGLLAFFLPGAASALAARFASPTLVLGWTTFLLFPIVTLAVKRLNYRNTVYRLHRDRVEIVEGFLTQHRKEVPFASVREVSLRRGILQRVAGLGSVYIATLATGQALGWSTSAILGGGSTLGSGAMLMDLANSEAAYTQVRELVDAQGA
jgi:membrane protein YdbS with pleckstrin-like domain